MSNYRHNDPRGGGGSNGNRPSNQDPLTTRMNQMYLNPTANPWELNPDTSLQQQAFGLYDHGGSSEVPQMPLLPLQQTQTRAQNFDHTTASMLLPGENWNSHNFTGIDYNDWTTDYSNQFASDTFNTFPDDYSPPSQIPSSTHMYTQSQIYAQPQAFSDYASNVPRGAQQQPLRPAQSERTSQDFGTRGRSRHSSPSASTRNHFVGSSQNIASMNPGSTVHDFAPNIQNTNQMLAFSYNAYLGGQGLERFAQNTTQTSPYAGSQSSHLTPPSRQYQTGEAGNEFVLHPSAFPTRFSSIQGGPHSRGQGPPRTNANMQPQKMSQMQGPVSFSPLAQAQFSQGSAVLAEQKPLPSYNLGVPYAGARSSPVPSTSFFTPPTNAPAGYRPSQQHQQTLMPMQAGAPLRRYKASEVPRVNTPGDSAGYRRNSFPSSMQGNNSPSSSRASSRSTTPQRISSGVPTTQAHGLQAHVSSQPRPAPNTPGRQPPSLPSLAPAPPRQSTSGLSKVPIAAPSFPRTRVFGKPRPYKCPVAGCPHAFSSNSDLKRHHLTHTQDKPFACQYCERRFASETNKNRHEPVHVCTFCPNTFFAHLKARNRHVAVVHEGSSRSQYIGKGRRRTAP